LTLTSRPAAAESQAGENRAMTARRGIIQHAAVFLAATLFAATLKAQDEVAPEIPIHEQIREEALRKNNDPAGCPLPLAASWNCGNITRYRQWGPTMMLEWMQEGHYVLPTFQGPEPDGNKELPPEYRDALRRCREMGLPFCIRQTAYDSLLTKSPYADLPPDENPNTLLPDGKIEKHPSPLGPVGPWRDAGKQWAMQEGLAKMMEVYPDPPLVIFLCNNEQRKLRWHEFDKSKRFKDKYGDNASDEMKRKLSCDGLKERLAALLSAYRANLPAETWRKNAAFVGFNAFGPVHYGRWNGWKTYFDGCDDDIVWETCAWDGASLSCYDNDWEVYKRDYLGWSMQTEAMNVVFMRAEALQEKPDFWLEVSVWDGAQGGRDKGKPAVYAKAGYDYSPERYRAWIQFVMWTLRPRVVREFRGSAEPLATHQQYWDALMAAVDSVHRTPLLRKFWRQGTLVPVRSRQPVFNSDVLEKYKDADRWFLLETSLMPPHLERASEIPVFAIALALGEKGAREWLVYAHAPMGDKKNVELTIPDSDVKVQVDVDLAGSYYHVREADGNAVRILLQ
jgi:hypothetical protein